MLGFYLGKIYQSAAIIQNSLPTPLWFSLPLLGKTCIPEGYDEASGPGLPVLAQRQPGTRRVLCMSLPPRPSASALQAAAIPPLCWGFGPRPRSRDPRLHPLRPVLMFRKPQTVEAIGGNRGKAKKGFSNSSVQVAVPHPACRMQHTTRALTFQRKSLRFQSVFRGAPVISESEQHKLCLPLSSPARRIQFVYLKYWVSCKCVLSEKNIYVHVYHSPDSFPWSCDLA